MEIFIKFKCYCKQGVQKKKKKPPRHWDLPILVTFYLKGAQANLALNINCSQTCLQKTKSIGHSSPYLNTAESYKNTWQTESAYFRQPLKDVICLSHTNLWVDIRLERTLK